MKLSYNVTGAERKALVGAISTTLNAPTKYLGMPSAAYEVGEYRIDKTGTLTGPDNLDLEDALHQKGFDADGDTREYDEPDTYESGLGGMGALPAPEELEAEGTTPAYEDLQLTERDELGLGKERREDYQGENGMSADDVPDTITIEIPFTSYGDLTKAKETLAALLQSKATLIQAALGEDAFWYAPEDEYSPENPGGWYGPAPRDNTLPIEFADGTVKFEWLRFGTDSDTVAAWSAFLAAAVKYAKTAKRVTAKDTAVENQKFAFRTFLVKIGMNDITNKVHRKRLLSNLTGDAAFATPESKAKWQAKHGKKTAKTEGTSDVE